MLQKYTEGKVPNIPQSIALVRAPGLVSPTCRHSAHGQPELKNVGSGKLRGEVFGVLHADKLQPQVGVAGWLIHGENLWYRKQRQFGSSASGCVRLAQHGVSRVVRGAALKNLRDSLECTSRHSCSCSTAIAMLWRICKPKSAAEIKGLLAYCMLPCGASRRTSLTKRLCACVFLSSA